jgi:hypothetical protein
MIFVTINEPADREVFVNEEYDEVAGTTPHTFMLPAGQYRFETLTAARSVDYRANTPDLPNGSNVTIELELVDPPEPTD